MTNSISNTSRHSTAAPGDRTKNNWKTDRFKPKFDNPTKQDKPDPLKDSTPTQRFYEAAIHDSQSDSDPALDTLQDVDNDISSDSDSKN